MRAAILRCDAGMENEHPEPRNRKSLLGENRMNHEHAHIGNQVAEHLSASVRVDVIDVVDWGTLVRRWKCISYLRDELLQGALIPPTLERHPVEAERKFIENFQEAQSPGALPQISVPDIALATDNNESCHRILRGQQIRFHVLIPVIVK
jgi:hypothetical protein